jgi:hypothetical protein
MSNWLWSIVWGWLPWWVWLAIGIALAVAAYRLLGWKGALAVLATTFGAVAYSSAARKGVAVERARQDAADDRVRDTIATKKAEVETLTDEERNERFSRWEKP